MPQVCLVSSAWSPLFKSRWCSQLQIHMKGVHGSSHNSKNMESQSKPYLQLGPRQIRLLEIVPWKTSESEDNNTIHCLLNVVVLEGNPDERPKYSALSYTWGSPADYGRFKRMRPEPDRVVMCNGCPVNVTENLHDFLQQARSMTQFANTRLWVDAICINQDDLDERGSQVRFMAEIYSSAEAVISWLGRADKHTEAGFATLEDIAKHVPDTWDGENQDSYDIAPDENEGPWVSAVKIFQRTYFTRVWMVQEIVLAKQVKVLCGPHELPWSAVEKSSHFFSTTGWGASLIRTASIASSPAERTVIRARLSAPAGLRATWMKYRSSKSSPQDWAQALLYALVRSRGFKATDKRDKVYSLLGLVGRYAQEKDELLPRYREDQSVAETYIDAAICILRDSDDLRLLSCVDGPRFQRHETGRLPSWVPDWSCELPTGQRATTGYEPYSASGSLIMRKPEIDLPNLTLTLRGLWVDRITKAGEVTDQIIHGMPFPRWLDIFDAMETQYPHPCADADGGESKLHAFWRTIFANAYKNPKRRIPRTTTLAGAFVTFLEMSVPIGRPRWWASRVSQMISTIQENWDSGASNAPEEDAYRPEGVAYEPIFFHPARLRLFLTETGYLGLGTECLEEGDSVWIVPGSRVPLILRATNTDVSHNSFTLVGGTYLHGVMYGEKAGSSVPRKKTRDEIENEMATFVLI